MARTLPRSKEPIVRTARFLPKGLIETLGLLPHEGIRDVYSDLNHTPAVEINYRGWPFGGDIWNKKTVHTNPMRDVLTSGPHCNEEVTSTPQAPWLFTTRMLAQFLYSHRFLNQHDVGCICIRVSVDCATLKTFEFHSPLPNKWPCTNTRMPPSWMVVPDSTHHHQCATEPPPTGYCFTSNEPTPSYPTSPSSVVPTAPVVHSTESALSRTFYLNHWEVATLNGMVNAPSVRSNRQQDHTERDISEMSRCADIQSEHAWFSYYFPTRIAPIWH